MIVRCDNCGTEFGFDDKQVGEGITVRCSVCKNVFKVESPSAAAAGWMIRTTEDTNFDAPDVATLREWIGEGRLHPDDQVSRTGRKWVRLGSMPEFAEAFSDFSGIEPVVKATPAPPARQHHPPIPPSTQARTRPESGPTRQPPPSPVRPHTREGVISTMPPIPPRGPGSQPRGGSPQSMRPTMSPPRSAPPQAAAPVAVSEAELLDSDEGSEGPSAAGSWTGVVAEISDEFEQAPTRVRPREESTPVRVPSAPASEARPDAAELAEPDEFEPAPRRGVSPAWILVGLLGVGVALVFAIPQTREPLMALITGEGGEEGVEGKVADRPELAAADAALQTLGVADSAKAEADLQRAIDAGDGDEATRTAMKVARADILLSRALVYAMAAALDEDQRADLELRAGEDQEDGERIVDSVEGGPDIDRLAEVRALARLAGGRVETEVMPLVPDDAVETRLIVEASVLWRDLDAPVPEGVVSGLLDLEDRSALGESALGLALLRAGDRVGADGAADRLLAGASDQIVGLALRSRLALLASEAGGAETGGAADTEGTDTAGTGEDSDSGGEGEGVAKPPPPPEEGSSGGGNSGGSGGNSGGGGFARLLEKGCDQVNSGDYREGIATLLEASDKRSGDFQLQLCLGRGYVGYGSPGRGLEYFEKALKTAPKSPPALIGAGKAAARSGDKQAAIQYYERLLAVDPNNSTAKAYLDKQAKPKPEPEPAPAGEGGGEG